jgi:hypothetical protein
MTRAKGTTRETRDMALADRVRPLRYEGKTLEQISEIVGIGIHAVSRLVRKYQIPANSKMPSQTVRTQLRKC